MKYKIIQTAFWAFSGLVLGSFGGIAYFGNAWSAKWLFAVFFGIIAWQYFSLKEKN